MSGQLQKLIQRLNTLEQEIREIRKARVVTQETKLFPEFPVITQEQTEQQVEQQLAAIEQVEQEELNCTLCSVTKPVDQRERKRENKNQVYATSVLTIGLMSVARNLRCVVLYLYCTYFEISTIICRKITVI